MKISITQAKDTFLLNQKNKNLLAELKKKNIALEKGNKDLQNLNFVLENKIEENNRTKAKLGTASQQLLHAEKLAAIGKMASSIAHEFGSPIFGIRNALQTIKNKSYLNNNDKDLINLSINECNRIKNLMDNLQSFNRPSSGSIAPMDIHQAIDNMVLLCKMHFNSKNITVEKQFAANLPNIYAVNDQIKQIILNILTNAEEAIPASGGCIKISTAVQNKLVMVQIQDTGTGIKQEDIKHIFDPFFTTKPGDEGTGLGLSVSFEIAKRHYGNILCESSLNCGTTFTVVLPVNSDVKWDTRVSSLN